MNAADSAASVRLDPAGRIVVCGTSHKGTVNDLDFVLWRLEDDGQLDATFASGGLFVHNGAAGGSKSDSGSALAITSGGEIYAAGASDNATGAMIPQATTILINTGMAGRFGQRLDVRSELPCMGRPS